MKTADVLQYICEQFPAAQGHLPLVEKLNQLEITAYRQGGLEAARLDLIYHLAGIKNHKTSYELIHTHFTSPNLTLPE